MQEIVLSNLDAGFLHDLEARAARHGRTPAEEAKAILTDVIAKQPADLWAPVDSIYQGLVDSGRDFADSAEQLREDRDR